MKSKIISLVVITCTFGLAMQAQNIIPFRHAARTYGANNSVATEAVVPNCAISITDDSKAHVVYTFENAVENKSRVEGIDYSHLRIKGFGINTRIGYPQLPGYTDIIAVNSQTHSVRIVSSDYVEYTDFDIFPAQIPETEGDTTQYPFIKDSIVYATNAFYPQNLVEVQDVQKYRGIPQALVRVNPVQYNPVTRTIRCHSNIVYELDNAMTAEELEAAMPYEVIATSEDSDTEEALYYTSPEKYIIVTTNKYKNTLNSFVQSKEDLGYKVVVLSKSSWSSSAEVKNAIQAEYNKNDNSRPRFLLIVGGHEDVPAEVKYEWSYNPAYNWRTEADYVTDHSYSCMDGDGDFWPDLARGRIPVNSTSELIAVIEKLTLYNNQQSYTGRIVSCAEFEPFRHLYWENDSTMERMRFIKTSEEIRNYLLMEQNYINVERIYYAKENLIPMRYNAYLYANGDYFPEELRSSTFNWRRTNIDIVNAINSKIDFIVYRGHGETTYWNNNMFSVADIPYLTNKETFPFIFSITCMTGQFYDVNNDSLCNCLASALLNAKQSGASGVIAGTFTTTAGYNDVFAEGMFNAMFPNPGISPQMGPAYNNHKFEGEEKFLNFTPYSTFDTIPVYAMGDVMNEGFKKMLLSYELLYNDNSQKNTQIQDMQRLHLFGDPSMEIYTEESQYLDEVIIQQINNCILVNTNGLEDCRVILKPIEEADSLEFQMVDHLTGTFMFASNTCNYGIIIQKHNCRPRHTYLHYNEHDVFLQNQTQLSNKTYTGFNIYAGKNVTSDFPSGDYTVKNGKNLILDARNNVVLSGGFTVEKGATLEIK